MTDSHQNYKDLDNVIGAMNRLGGVDFVVNLGDVTNSGYNLEYDQFLYSYTNLNHPKLNIVGNHDLIGAGYANFEKAFGPWNYFIESQDFRFIFFNASDLEKPDAFFPQWLLDRVNETTKKVIIFSHEALNDAERYKTGNSKQILDQVLQSSQVVAAFNGHGHFYSYTTNGHVPMIQVPRVEGGQWVVIDLQATGFQFSKIWSGEDFWVAF